MSLGDGIIVAVILACVVGGVTFLSRTLDHLARDLRDIRDSIPSLKAHRDTEVEYLRAKVDKLEEVVLALTRPDVQGRLAVQSGKLPPPQAPLTRPVAARSAVRVVDAAPTRGE